MARTFYIANSRWLSHVIFWAAWMAINVFFLGSYETPTRMCQLYLEVCELPEKMLVVYLNLYWLIPAFLMKRQYWTYGIYLSVLIIGMAFIMRAIYTIWLGPLWFPETTKLPFFHIYRLLKYIFYNLNGVVLVTTGFRLFNYWYQQQQMNTRLMEEKLQSELTNLKSQLHPHFLFNTLNNIYSLCLDKSDQAPGVVLKLSELLSYMLYDARKDSICLSKEIEQLKSYLELEKIRYGDRINISFNVSGPVECKEIAPLMMLPFVENAFKHGFSNDLHNIWITIDIKLKNDIFYMKVKNSMPLKSCAEKPASGIGLQNIRRRLELLYPEKYSLDITTDADFFEVDLKLQLQ